MVQHRMCSFQCNVRCFFARAVLLRFSPPFPLCGVHLLDRCTLQLRLDAVEELIGNERLFFELGAVLAPFPDLDLLYTAFVQLPHEVTAKVAQHRINALVGNFSLLPICEFGGRSCYFGERS